MSNIMQYVQAFFALLGALYVIFSVLGSFLPATSAFGNWCRTIAADIKMLLAKAPPGLTSTSSTATPEKKPEVLPPPGN